MTFASAFGNDPVKAVNALAKKNAAAIAKAGSTGAFVTGRRRSTASSSP